MVKYKSLKHITKIWLLLMKLIGTIEPVLSHSYRSMVISEIMNGTPLHRRGTKILDTLNRGWASRSRAPATSSTRKPMENEGRDSPQRFAETCRVASYASAFTSADNSNSIFIPTMPGPRVKSAIKILMNLHDCFI